MNSVHEPDQFWKLSCQFPPQSITGFSPPSSGRAAPPASTARARAPLRSHLRHREPHGRATPTGLGTVLSAPVQPSPHSALQSAHQGQRGARGPTCSCVGQGRDTCPAVRSVLVFSVSQGDFLLCVCGFHFLWICCQEREKQESRQKQSGEPVSRFSKIQCKIVVFWGKGDVNFWNVVSPSSATTLEEDMGWSCGLPLGGLQVPIHARAAMRLFGALRPVTQAEMQAPGPMWKPRAPCGVWEP